MSDRDHSWEDAVQWLRQQPEHADLVRDCYFDDPLLDASKRYYRSTEWEAVRRLVDTGAGRSVLEIGAGRGISSYAFARDGWQVTALEPDPSEVVGAGAIRSLSKSLPRPIEVVEAWGEVLPFPDESFDLVYGRQVLHHARDLKTLCKEMVRVLRPGGILLATREHVIFRESDLPQFLAKHPLHHLYGGEHAYFLKDYRQAIEDAGVRITSVMNPWASDINMFPRTSDDIRELIRGRLPFLPSAVLTPTVLKQLGWLLRSPGASYSFLGVREGS